MAIKFLQSVDIEGALECNSFTIGGVTSVPFEAGDHTKLDGIATNANAYSLPAASATVVGGVKYKTNTTNSVAPANVTNTSARTYAVQKSATGNTMVVNVPWSSNDLEDASTETRGIMTANDKSKLDEIAAGATANVGDVTLAGTQTLSGAKTLSSITTISSTSASSSKTTGALRISGGAGILGTLNVGLDVIAFASSDKRYKDNLTPITNPIDKVKSLTGYTFTWNDKHEQFNGNNDIGVVAQEVEKVFPEIVDTRDDGYKAVKYEKIVAVLIEAIKDQQKQIDELKTICDGCSR
jgi:Tfp pilus assembly protein FimT